ncbi:hypothetical protein Baya_7130 [Bagarius yarrelli]|uniref:Uncharacterized protein n=1 Tax=Bagarius yarrelli TaxID=175774 RepID=A0A556TZE0_BAGYA|nr:hypothetical protein Baya_7130 [Bagarius yarrelli]
MQSETDKSPAAAKHAWTPNTVMTSQSQPVFLSAKFDLHEFIKMPVMLSREEKLTRSSVTLWPGLNSRPYKHIWTYFQTVSMIRERTPDHSGGYLYAHDGRDEEDAGTSFCFTAYPHPRVFHISYFRLTAPSCVAHRGSWTAGALLELLLGD